MKPLALDLCCGIWDGGWAKGLVAAGWDVIGVDIEDQGGYSGHKILADVREIAKDPEAYFPSLKFDLVVASPPCQEFSYKSFPFKACKAAPDPDQSIWKACEEIALKLKAPLVLENVRGANKYMGRAKAHYGSFYFWGDVPALIPIGRPFKGFYRAKRTSGNQHTGGFKTGNPSNLKGQWDKKSFEGVSDRIDNFHAQGERAPGGKRKEWSAKAAMIPLEFSTWIGECFYPQELKESKLAASGQ